MTNTTMAPVEQIKQALGDLARRHDSLHDIRELRKDGKRRDTGAKRRAFDGKFGGVGNGRGDSNNPANGNRGNRFPSNDNGPGFKDRSKLFNFFDRNRGNGPSSAISPATASEPNTSKAPGPAPEPSPGPSPEPSPEPSPAKSTTPAARPTEDPVVTSPEATPRVVSSSLVVPLISSVEAVLTPTALPVQALPVQAPSSIISVSPPESTPNLNLAGISGASRKEVLAGPTSLLASASLTPKDVVTTTVSTTPQGSTSLAATPFNNTPFPSSLPQNVKAEGMSPLAERLLIAAGTIGAFVVIMAAIYVILRIQRKDPFSFISSRKARKSQSGSRHRRRKQSRQISSEPPPSYFEDKDYFEIPTLEKTVPSQRQWEAFRSPNVAPELSIPARVAMFASPNLRPQETNLLSPISNAERTGSSRAPSELPALPAELETVEVKSGLLSHKLSDSEDYSNTGTQNTSLTRPISDSYNLTGRQVTLLTRQTTNINDTDHLEASRFSQLSSLSSGFGDGLINTDGGPLPYSAARYQSRPQRTSRFSWQTSNGQRTPGPRQDRSSTLTTSSVESAPRFRSIGSWVAQQSGRAERQQKNAVPAFPRIGQEHQRKKSEVSAFRQHPGEEVEFRPGSRVPSSILDRKLGHG